jgi:hypothetical protein
MPSAWHDVGPNALCFTLAELMNNPARSGHLCLASALATVVASSTLMRKLSLLILHTSSTSDFTLFKEEATTFLIKETGGTTGGGRLALTCHYMSLLQMLCGMSACWIECPMVLRVLYF